MPGKRFDPTALDANALSEIEAGAAAARDAIVGNVARFGTRVHGWSIATETIGVYGNAYLKRATIALGGLGANPPEDAVYPVLVTDADGDQTTGDQNYVIHFDADKLPPVDAFWSITMYDAEGYQAANELDRFAIGDRDPLTYNLDGSLDIFIQHSNPGPAREANWLPAPTGPLGVTMRLYAPRAEVLDLRWTPPPLDKTESEIRRGA